MEYLIGSLGTVVFFALIGGAYYLGTKQKKPRPTLNEEEQRKQEQLRKDFDEMMGYSLDKAMGGGRR